MYLKTYVYFVAAFLLAACGSVKYSFTGASFTPDTKTVSILYFPSYAPLAKPTLSQTFTEGLKDIFINQTNLSLVESNGDLQFSGDITDYKTAPIAITSGETAALNRLTITVKVKFVNTKDDQRSFESSFTRYADYDSSQNLSDVEDELISNITTQLIQDIFNKAASNW